jgi:hypothetical protein
MPAVTFLIAGQIAAGTTHGRRRQRRDPPRAARHERGGRPPCPHPGHPRCEAHPRPPQRELRRDTDTLIRRGTSDDQRLPATVDELTTASATTPPNWRVASRRQVMNEFKVAGQGAAALDALRAAGFDPTPTDTTTDTTTRHGADPVRIPVPSGCTWCPPGAGRTDPRGTTTAPPTRPTSPSRPATQAGHAVPASTEITTHPPRPSRRPMRRARPDHSGAGVRAGQRCCGRGPADGVLALGVDRARCVRVHLGRLGRTW